METEYDDIEWNRPKYFKTEPFVVNGVKYAWCVDMWNSKPTLSRLRSLDNNTLCGNPWNNITHEDREEIMKYCPKRNVLKEPFDEPGLDMKLYAKPIISTNYFVKDSIIKELKYIFMGDTWCVYSSDQYKKPIKNYNDTQLELDVILNDLNEGLIVNIVLNRWFLDYVIQKIPNQEIYIVIQI